MHLNEFEDSEAIPVVYSRNPSKKNIEALIKGHLQLVRKIAWHVHGRVSNAIEIEDLIQIGMVALIEAANAFENRGFAFATYASMRIRGAMIDYMRQHAATGRSSIARRKTLNKTREELEAALGRPPEDSEMAEKLGMTASEYREWADSAISIRQESLDDVYSDHSSIFSDETADPVGDLERQGLQKALAEHIQNLPEREAMVLQLYYVEELNLKEIGEVLDLGTARISQIKKAAVDHLRQKMTDWQH
ncbi:MAG: FliA/WhiG family RNA polymerase sigma factor [Zymomonas mobilis subsp. pomaceae]|uniref:RNA polymerase, sigma 28 subunit, FliA/WhiG n=1 Tax=Zymomonas mobilis subsp. pomaceae (strain ATCC 29192 / DSM 22645 / JCM 10191 / CCUG 17912 / NBRC 13757 / NCIMB 11200 / NRRL B-4491 / Barker I) TaxID=579138 RepID=F8ERP3_ZYMMT|nr:FliA/WhiG family RNA polymerase sigma factor [Zymomonas mobilis]AEI37501.1 RNA polymerase, sigma 28 subunit, FliA/WhiG [Zymomonas mobilis subsp. pomaceae ATCC 29192]MDX5948869.1 FliA/WhiG family RNA polymerase sigma factor [Zymomonas mobilis subsp. pomaceae]GEB88676.1 DNA-directed RNA polymerase sigma-70 factor [Zymomonas mobilis subsp. pomaceae]